MVISCGRNYLRFGVTLEQLSELITSDLLIQVHALVYKVACTSRRQPYKAVFHLLECFCQLQSPLCFVVNQI